MPHEDPDHFVALLAQQVGRDARIDSAAHGQYDTEHIASLGLERARGKKPASSRGAGKRIIRRGVGQAVPDMHTIFVRHYETSGAPTGMEKEYIDRAKAIRQGILQLRDSL
jgi:hypothetical protein